MEGVGPNVIVAKRIEEPLRLFVECVEIFVAGNEQFGLPVPCGESDNRIECTGGPHCLVEFLAFPLGRLPDKKQDLDFPHLRFGTNALQDTGVFPVAPENLPCKA